MRRVTILAIIGLAVGLAVFLGFETFDRAGEPTGVDPIEVHAGKGGDSPGPADWLVAPSSRGSTSSGSEKVPGVDLASIGLPDLSPFDLAPGVETVLQEWHDAGCIHPESVSLEGLDQATRHRAEEWLAEEGDLGGLDASVVAVAPKTFGDYASYSDDSLERLADDANDPKAALALAVRSHQQEDSLPQARDYYEQAIILGYTRPLIDMPTLHYRILMKPSDNEPGHTKAQWEYEVERLTNGLLRERRGAPFTLVERLLLYIQSRKSGLASNHSWEETLREARDRAERRYQEYSQRRRELGLGPFDNSRPAIASRLDRYGQLVTLGATSDLDLCSE